MNPLATSLQGREIWPQEINKSHPKSEQKRCLKKPHHHSSPLTTCSLWVMMDKDFSRWDEIKIYMHCFLSQLVGRSSSFNSISAASDGHPESRLSHGAVSWQGASAAGTSGAAGLSDGCWPPSKLLQAAGAPLHPQHCSSPPPPTFFFFLRESDFHCSIQLLFSAIFYSSYRSLGIWPWDSSSVSFTVLSLLTFIKTSVLIWR